MTTPESVIPYIQTAIYQRLAGDGALMGMVTGVYDDVPEPAPHPYVEIGEATESPDNWHGGFGSETVVTLHVWTKFRGYSQGLAIASRIVTLLDHQPLSLSGGHRVIAVRHEMTQTLRDSDPEIRHIPVRFLVVTAKDN